MGKCFVMMPFGGYFDSYYANVIKPAIAKAGLLPVRADEIYSTGAIIDDIHKGIIGSAICLADVTGKNPNVSYELGMAHALNKPVVITTQDIRDIPFDYRHLRVIKYDPLSFGWEVSFAESLERTIREIAKDPNGNLALRTVKTEQDIMRLHLKNLFFEVDCELEKIDEYWCGDNGNVTAHTQWNVKARSPVYHLCHNLVTERPGLIEVRRAYDRLSGRELDYVILEGSATHLSYLFLLKQYKNPGQHFIINTEVFAEGFIDGLYTRGESTMSHQALNRSGIQYTRKIERYHFPMEPRFSRVRAKYISHPIANKIGTEVPINSTHHGYVLELIYDSILPYRQETGALLTLS